MNLNDKATIKAAIENGTPCYYQCGFSYKGASKHPITKEKALEYLPKYSPGLGFYELREDKEGNIIFNEYTENDLY